MADPEPYKKVESLKLLYGEDSIDNYIAWIVETAVPAEMSFLQFIEENFQSHSEYMVAYDNMARFIINRQLTDLWQTTSQAAITMNRPVQDLIGKVRIQYQHANLEAVLHERYFPHEKQEAENEQT